MLFRFLAALGLALALFSSSSQAQTVTTYTYLTLPASPSAGQLAWITDNAGTATVGAPASGGAAPGNRDLVAWDAVDSRWEFVTRVPSTSSSTTPTPAIDATFAGYSNASPGVVGLALANVRQALDWVIESVGTELVCSTELVRGVGYNPVTKRYRKTCADFNWHGWQDPTQASASWVDTCTGEGAPHAACMRAGDKAYVGYGLHRLALAVQYTEDGGEVIALDHPYIDGGAGLLQGGGRAKFPLPYDPAWEARPEFARLGYPTELRAIQINRGIRLVGSGAPDAIESLGTDATVSSATPKLVGSWLRDDRGPAPTVATAVLDGPAANISPPTMYRTIVGWNTSLNYCNTTSNTDPACNNAVDSDEFDGPSVNEYAYQSPILANFTDTGSSTVCVSDTISGTSNATYTGVCRENRMVRCGNATGVAAGRNTHGCIFDTDSDGDFTSGDTGNLNLGICESFADALAYDRTTRLQDIQLALSLPQCADDASSSSDCQITAGVGWNVSIVDIATPIGSWTGPLGLNGGACGAGGSVVEVGSVGAVAGNFSFPGQRRNYYLGSPYMTATAVRRDRMDLRGAGVERFGFLPVSWYGRNSASLGDCLSAGDYDHGDDEAACDTDTQFAFAWGHNGRIGPQNLFYRASHTADKSAVVETFPGGGPNYFSENRIRDVLRGVLTDWGEGVFERNVINGYGVADPNPSGAPNAMVSCYSDECEVRDNLFERFKVSNAYQFTFNSNNVRISGNKYRQGSIAFGGQLYLVRDQANLVIEDEEYSGIWGNATTFLRIVPGYGGRQKPTVIFRRNRGIIAADGFQGNTPAAIVLVENSTNEDTRTDEFRQIVIAENTLQTRSSNQCLLWLEDDTATALTRESAGRISVYANAIFGPGSPDIVCAGDYTGTPGTLFDAANDRGLSAENFLPMILGNSANLVAVANQTSLFRSESGLDADTLPDGTRVTVYDGTAGCAHTTGNLTAGAARVTCVAHPGGAGDDGTWTVD